MAAARPAARGQGGGRTPPLTGAEEAHLRAGLRREPTEAEVRLAEAEWSEHCSYKSSRAHLDVLPRDGPHVLKGGSYDSGVLDVGGGYVVSIHIESHNHPSAVEPYGGAATGVGGVVRDILSTGTRPIAVLNGLRFGDPRSDPLARWRLKRAVEGIADYGNCIGVPTVGGEVGFDESYNGYALVDVAAVGFGRRESLVPNSAEAGDAVHLVGGATGRDGIGGAGFASDGLGGGDGGDDHRSAVQIPDPFTEKLVIEAVLAARSEGIVRAMKDLGGGGLACAVSETADSLGVGIDMDIGAVHVRDSTMGDADVLVSESQERMLLVTSRADSARLAAICKRFGVRCSAIGAVRRHGRVRVRGADGSRIVHMPASLAAHAPLLDRPARRPDSAGAAGAAPGGGGGGGGKGGLSASLERMLASPAVASKSWAYGQYDHEVGIRTVVGPGRDAAVLRLDNGRFLAVSMDGNPRHCSADPAAGAAGCFEEACRNVACAGARPIGMVDHLQFGSPEDPGVFWAFLESLRSIAAQCRASGVPCVGGKVSFYNETDAGPIKPTPLIAVAGLADAAPPRWGGATAATAAGVGWAAAAAASGAPADAPLFAVGATYLEETAAAEYAPVAGAEWDGAESGAVPRVRPAESAASMEAVIGAVSGGLAAAAHDCSKGGLAVAAAELCLWGSAGCEVRMGAVPASGGGGGGGGGGGPSRDAALLFSESHSRYLLVAAPGRAAALRRHLSASGAHWAEVGRIGGGRRSVRFVRGGGGRRGGSGGGSGGAAAASITLKRARAAWTSWSRGGAGTGAA